MRKLVAFGFALVCVLGLLGCSSEADSVGIIGGADGPTAILLTYSIAITKWMYVIGFIGIVVVAVLVALFIYCKKKKK